MKKLSILFACAAALLGFTACDSETDPKYHAPEEGSFVLNVPAFAGQYLELTKGDFFEVTCSQPDYGYAAVAVYNLEVSLTEDFEKFETVAPKESGSARMQIPDQAFAVALCNLKGFTSDTFEDLPAFPVYIRATCQLNNVEGSAITSNVVTLQQVKLYHATEGARVIYLVGSPSGWMPPEEGNAAHYEKYQLTETGVGTNIYSGSFTFAEGSNMFRFYTELSGWGADGSLPSVGSNPNDNDNTTITLVDGKATLNAVPGKGSWELVLPAETTVLLTVNLDKMTVTVEPGAIDWNSYPCIYLAGNPSGWVEPVEDNADKYENYRLFDMDGSGIYVSKPDEPFIFPAGDNYFRFYATLTGWGEDGKLPSMGPNPTDGDNLTCDFTDNVFSGAYVPGKGSWMIHLDADTPVAIQVNTNDQTVKFTLATE